MSYYVEMANEALAEYEAQKQTDAQGALAVVKASGARMATHSGNCIVAVPPAEDTPELRDALRTLGYGACRVLHLETAPYKGQSSATVSEAIESAGGEL
jgi:hypothetical protein